MYAKKYLIIVGIDKLNIDTCTLYTFNVYKLIPDSFCLHDDSRAEHACMTCGKAACITFHLDTLCMASHKLGEAP